MKQGTLQRDLFDEGPAPQLPPDRRAALLQLIQTLLIEVITGRQTDKEDGDDQDHR